MSTSSATASTADTARRAALVGTGGYLFACLLWGLNLPLSAALLQHFDPFWVSPLRYVVATLLLGAMVLATAGPAQLRCPIPLWRVAVLSLCVAGFLVLYNLGLFHTHPMTVAAISAGSPVYVAVVSRRDDRRPAGARLLGRHPAHADRRRHCRGRPQPRPGRGWRPASRRQPQPAGR